MIDRSEELMYALDWVLERKIEKLINTEKGVFISVSDLSEEGEFRFDDVSISWCDSKLDQKYFVIILYHEGDLSMKIAFQRKET